MSNRWDARKILSKWIERNVQSPAHCCVEFSQVNIYHDGDKIPIAEIESALIKAARIVERHGPNYVGWFERIEQELAIAKEREETLKRIGSLAREGDLFNSKGNALQPRSFLLQAWAVAISRTNIFMSH